MEKTMRTTCLTKNTEDYAALNQAYYFWLVIDLLFASNRAEIFKHLYMKPACFKDTYIKVSMMFGVSLRTLERYRKDFVLSFKIISDLIANLKIFPNAG